MLDFNILNRAAVGPNVNVAGPAVGVGIGMSVNREGRYYNENEKVKDFALQPHCKFVV